MRIISRPLIANVLAMAASLSAVCAAPATVRAIESGDQVLQERVRDALHADPFFYDEHVTVAVVDGKVFLHGFVFSDWDLRNAIRIASRAADGHRVIDELSIKEGGKR